MLLRVDALFFLAFFLLIPVSRRILHRFLVPGNKRDRLETLTQCSDWFQFALRLLFLEILPKTTTFDPFESSTRHPVCATWLKLQRLQIHSFQTWGGR